MMLLIEALTSRLNYIYAFTTVYNPYRDLLLMPTPVPANYLAYLVNMVDANLGAGS